MFAPPPTRTSWVNLRIGLPKTIEMTLRLDNDNPEHEEICVFLGNALYNGVLWVALLGYYYAIRHHNFARCNNMEKDISPLNQLCNQLCEVDSDVKRCNLACPWSFVIKTLVVLQTGLFQSIFWGDF